MSDDFIEDNTIFLLNEDGTPIAAVDPLKITKEAGELIGDLAINAGNERAVVQILEACRIRNGEGFKYITAAALKHMVCEVLDPVLSVAEEVAPDIRDNLEELLKS